ncbi:MAG: hypothetical protein GC182_03075 [Rhodopseudomonas sp.]|nr:hypothetical protein [Rhodopseudomonas sp.]
MKRFVVDENAATSVSNDGEFESFDSYAKAEKRAVSLATLSPGCEFDIYERVATTLASVNKAMTVKDKAAG